MSNKTDQLRLFAKGEEAPEAKPLSKGFKSDLPPVPELRHVEDPYREENLGPRVASEYECQRRAARRELAWTRGAQLLVRVAVLALVVGGAYGAAGYLAFVRLPDAIARLEQRIAIARASQNLLADLKAKSGLAAADKNRSAQLKALAKLFGAPEFAKIDGNAPDRVALARRLKEVDGRLQALQRQTDQQEKRVKGMGRGGDMDRARRDKAVAELKRLRSALDAAGQARDRELETAFARLKALESLAQSPEGVAASQDRLDRLRVWRERLTVWPLPRYRHLFNPKEP